MMESSQSSLYRLFCELCRRHSPEEVRKWGAEHWAGLDKVLRAMAGESITWREKAAAPADAERWKEVAAGEEHVYLSFCVQAEPPARSDVPAVRGLAA